MTENSAASTKPRRKRQSIGLTTLYSKRKGMMAELIFVVKAASMGFAVSKPYGDSEPYDLIVEHNGRVFRIQVKSVFTTSRWGYSVSVARNRQHKPIVPYSAQEIDFLAAYVVAHDAWYIVPVAELANLSHIRLYPEGAKRQDGALFEKYRDAWDLLRLGAARPTEA
jgi:PD-(D/E)XK endonuclease